MKLAPITASLRVAALLGSLSWPGVALAQAHSAESIEVEFEYRAPGECPSAQSAFGFLRRHSERARQVEAGIDTEPDSRLVLTVEPGPQGYHGRLDVLRPGQAATTRQVEGRTCAEVVEALALTAALSIDPDATLTASEPGASSGGGDEPGASAATLPAAKTSSPEPTAFSQVAPVPLRWALGGELGASHVFADTWHLQLGASATSSRLDGRVLLPFEFRAALLASVDRVFSRLPELRTDLVLVELGYCLVRWGGASALLLCPVLEAGLVLARGDGVSEGTSVTRGFVSLGADAVGRLSVLENLELGVAMGPRFPLTRRQFGLDPDQLVITEAMPVGFDAAVSIRYTF